MNAEWHYFHHTDDGYDTWDIIFGIKNKREKASEPLLECQTESHAKQVTDLLNKLKIGPAAWRQTLPALTIWDLWE